jgi:lipid-A-disaccharide synthase
LNTSCLIIAGEKSGEEHAMSFFPKLKEANPQTLFFGVGGSELQNAGLELIYHLNEFSSWGYSEVIAKIPFYKKALEEIVNEVVIRNCKVAILIDFQSFNMKLAGRLREIGVKVEYLVAPQAWAWKEYRVKKLAKSVDTLFTIIPFEKKWFEERGVNKVIGVEHPQLTLHKNEINKFKRSAFNKDKIKVLLLPGSRNFEVKELLNDFLDGIKILKKDIDISISIVKSSSVSVELYTEFDEYFDKVYSNEQLVDAIKEADFGIAASGTVTLTCALFELPTIVCYKTSFLNYFIYETFVNYKGFVCLANIVHNSSVFPELLQESLSSFNIAWKLKLWYYDQVAYTKVCRELSETKNLVKGENIEISTYVSSIINNIYAKKTSSIL